VKKDSGTEKVGSTSSARHRGTDRDIPVFRNCTRLALARSPENDDLTVDNGGGQAVPSGGGIIFDGGADTDFFRMIGANSTDPGTITATTFHFGTQDGDVHFSNTETLKFQTGAYGASVDLGSGADPNVDVEANATLTSGATQHFGTLSIASTGKLVMSSNGSHILVTHPVAPTR
jgi:hypothetical protein